MNKIALIKEVERKARKIAAEKGIFDDRTIEVIKFTLLEGMKDGLHLSRVIYRS